MCVSYHVLCKQYLVMFGSLVECQSQLDLGQCMLDVSNGAAGMAVFDTMRYVKSDVSTVCVGLAASMGAFILASGQKV